MRKVAVNLIFVGLLSLAALPAWALDPTKQPKDNFDLTHWKLQLPINSSGVLSGTNDYVEVSASDLNSLAYTNGNYYHGQTTNYFYTGPDGAMTFWVPDNGATTSGSTHPRSELREQMIPGNDKTNWTLYGTHIMTAICVVSNVPSDTGKVCIGQMHEPTTKPDGSASAGNEHMIMFDLSNQKIYVNVSPDGNSGSSISQTFITGSGVALGKPINYTMSMVDGVLRIVINNVTNSWDLFSGIEYNHSTDPGLLATNWNAASGNTLYFKAGDYNQTTNACSCSTDGARVAFYALTRYHAPAITNQPASTNLTTGQKATFTVAASGNGTLSYQWQFKGTNLSGKTSSTLTLTNVAATNAGNYTVVVSDNSSSFSSVTSSVAMLTVNKATPTLTAPTASGINYGQTLTNSTLSGGAATNAANSAAVAGGFAFTTPTTAPGAGTASQSVTFTPVDTTNYNTATTSVSVTVARAGLTVSGITANNKPYDGNTTATLNTGGAALIGNLDGPNVLLGTAGATGTFTPNGNIGIGKTVQVSGLAISGSATNNYTLAQPTTTASILAPPGTVSSFAYGVMNINFFGIPNSNYVVLTTTNLGMSWWPVRTNTAGSNSMWLFTDSNATNGQQFYRVVTP